MNIDVALKQAVREEVQSVLAELLPRQESSDYLTTKQVSELTGLSISFFEVGRSMSNPDHPPYHKVGRKVIYRRDDVVAWLEQRRRG